MLFITVQEFKTRLNAAKVDIVRSPKTSKLFASVNGTAFKVEQSLHSKEEIKFMYTDEAAFTDGCFVNVTPTTPPIMVL